MELNGDALWAVPPQLRGSEIPPFADSFHNWRKKLHSKPQGSFDFSFKLKMPRIKLAAVGKGWGSGNRGGTSPDEWTRDVLLAFAGGSSYFDPLRPEFKEVCDCTHFPDVLVSPTLELYFLINDI